MTVGIIAKMQVQPDKGSEFEQAFQKLQEVVRAEEPGCLLYALCRDEKTPDTYWVMEQYRDADARKAHGQSDGFRAAAQKMGPLMAGGMEMHLCTIVS